jgi:hypothetical protein
MTRKKVISTLVLVVLPATGAIYFWSRSTDVTNSATSPRAGAVPAPQVVKLIEEGEGKPWKAVKGGTSHTPARTEASELRRPGPPPSPPISTNPPPDNSGPESLKRPIMASLPHAVDEKPQTQATAAVTPEEEGKPATAAKGETHDMPGLRDGQADGRPAPPTPLQKLESATPEEFGSLFVRRPIVASAPQAVDEKPQTQGTAIVTLAKGEKPATATKGETRGTPGLRDGQEYGRPAPPMPLQKLESATPEEFGSLFVRRPIVASAPQAVDEKPQTQGTAVVTLAKGEKPATATKGETRGTPGLRDGQEYGRPAPPMPLQKLESATPEESGSETVRQPMIASLPQAVDRKPRAQETAAVTAIKEGKPPRPSTEIRDTRGNDASVSRGEEQPQGPLTAPPLPGSRARRSYRVRAGDCLATIASNSEVYGNFNMWKALYLANPEAIDYVYYRKTLPYAILEAGIELQVPESSEARRLMSIVPKSRPLIIKLAKSSDLTEMLHLAVDLKRVDHQVYIQELPSATGTQYVVKLGFFKSKKEARKVLKSLPIELHRDHCAILRASEHEMREHLPFARRETD